MRCTRRNNYSEGKALVVLRLRSCVVAWLGIFLSETKMLKRNTNKTCGSLSVGKTPRIFAKYCL